MCYGADDMLYVVGLASAIYLVFIWAVVRMVAKDVE